MYLIKIAFLEGGKNKLNVAEIKDINNLLNIIINLGSESRFLKGDAGGINKFMRTQAFQQLWFHPEITSYDMARQIIIFSADADNDLNAKFLAITDISIELFLQLLVASWSGFIDGSGRIHITKDWFAPLGCPEKTIQAFFRVVSLSTQGTKELFENHYEKTDDKLLQLTEQTPLKQYPFMNLDGNYYCYSPHVLQEKIKHSLYDLLKIEYGSKFTQAFGVLFEKYIYRLMDESGIKHLKETDLKNIFKNKRVCDALIELDDAIILIEAKGVEMHPYAQINPTNAILTKHLKTSIVKSFEQIYELSNTLHDTDEGRAILNGRTIFAIVVTYKEMYLSDGKDLWDEFLAEPLQAYIDEKGLDITCIPLKNILFSSVKSFEDLVKIVLANGNILSRVINKAVEDNLDHATKKYLFEMHLDQYGKTPIPFLDEAFGTITSKLEARLS